MAEDNIIVEESKEKQNASKLDDIKKIVKDFFAKPWVHVGIGVAAGIIAKPVAAAAKQLVMELIGGSDEHEAADSCPDDGEEEMPF